MAHPINILRGYMTDLTEDEFYAMLDECDLNLYDEMVR